MRRPVPHLPQDRCHGWYSPSYCGTCLFSRHVFLALYQGKNFAETLSWEE
ncbi:predicted protein [Botrytis cinerea T4]|uniref:Uncharacterized protein n=1 Tax=Botryotinia fuckeliana (strain T4) TaxID=999810 RepID=G2Y562_BOTF4|nr:predicted protein [Botrytis cinerea T4]